MTRNNPPTSARQYSSSIDDIVWTADITSYKKLQSCRIKSLQGNKSDYTGIISVKLWNTGDKPFTILIGDRIAQGVFAYVTRPAHIPVSDHIRGTGGFGSTGRGD